MSELDLAALKAKLESTVTTSTEKTATKQFFIPVQKEEMLALLEKLVEAREIIQDFADNTQSSIMRERLDAFLSSVKGWRDE